MTLSEARKLEWTNPETRAKRIAGMSGKKRTDEFRRRLSLLAKGKIVSAATREKFRIRMLGTKASKETRRKMSETHKRIGSGKWSKGIRLSLETRAKISQGLKGMVFTEERRRHISEALTGKTFEMLGRKKKDPKLVYENKLNHNRRRRAIKLQAVGSHALEDWLKLKEKYLNMCLCCKRREPEIKLTEDHVIPLSMGGSDFIENIQPLCLSCNPRKYNRTIDYRIEGISF